MTKTDQRNQAPDGREFVPGEIRKTHEVGPYAIVEYIPNRPINAGSDWCPCAKFHPYVQSPDTGELDDTHHSYDTLDRALAASVAYRQEWEHRGHNAAANTRADDYFMRMVGP